MEKKGDATVLETLNLFQAIGGLLFFFLMLFALDYYYGGRSEGYVALLGKQLDVGSNLVKNVKWDSGITYLVNGAMNLEGENVIAEKSSKGFFEQFKTSKIIIEKKNGRLKIYETKQEG